MLARRDYLTLLAFLLAVGAALLIGTQTPAVWATDAHSPARQTVPPARSIGGTVFDDQNRNGELDPGEPGIPGVSIRLTNTGMVSDTMTNVLGNYEFLDLMAGEIYTVTETDPPGYASTTPNVVTATVSADLPAVVNFGDYMWRLFLPLVLRAG